MSKSLFILCLATLTLLGLVRSSILTLRNDALTLSGRQLSKDKKVDMRKINDEKVKLVTEKIRNYYRAQAKEKLAECLSLDLVKKYVTRPRKAAKPGQSKTQLTEEERELYANEAFQKIQTNCVVAFLNSEESETQHPTWNTQRGCIFDLFSSLHSYHHYTQECSDFSVSLKNYNNMLKGIKQNFDEKAFFDVFKNFYFRCADVLKINEVLYKLDAASIKPLIADTVVSINEVYGAEADRFASGTASGNLVSFNPKTLRFNNICNPGDKKVSVNFLLTALHCLKGWDELIFPEKSDRYKVNPAFNVDKEVALVPMKYHVQVFNDLYNKEIQERQKNGQLVKEEDYSNKEELAAAQKRQEDEILLSIFGSFTEITSGLKNKIMTPEKSKNDPRELKADIPKLATGTKIVGEDVVVNIFQDQDIILVKLANPISIDCKSKMTLDFSHANVDRQARDAMLQAVQDKNSHLNLYGFPGSHGPYRMKMEPLKRELLFPDERPEGTLENFNELKDIAIKGFTLNGPALNGASGGPLFLEEENSLKYIATVIRGSEHSLTDLEVKFNARKMPTQ